MQGVNDVEALDGAALFGYFNLPLGGDRWLLLGSDGRSLGEVSLPGRFMPWASSGELLYGVETDPLGIERIAIYRLEIR